MNLKQAIYKKSSYHLFKTAIYSYIKKNYNLTGIYFGNIQMKS